LHEQVTEEETDSSLSLFSLPFLVTENSESQQSYHDYSTSLLKFHTSLGKEFKELQTNTEKSIWNSDSETLNSSFGSVSF
jgi:hypothetical protein